MNSRMANAFYSYLVFVEPDSEANITALKDNLTSFYCRGVQDPVVIIEKDEITVSFKEGYQFHIFFSAEPDVQMEAIEIAESGMLDWNDAAVNKEKLKSCKSRFDVWVDADYDMDYFNDSLYIVQTIEEFSGVTIFST